MAIRLPIYSFISKLYGVARSALPTAAVGKADCGTSSFHLPSFSNCSTSKESASKLSLYNPVNSSDIYTCFSNVVLGFPYWNQIEKFSVDDLICDGSTVSRSRYSYLLPASPLKKVRKSGSPERMNSIGVPFLAVMICPSKLTFSLVATFTCKPTASSSPSLQAPKKRLAMQMAMSLYVFIIYDAFMDEYFDYQPGLFCVISLFTLISASGIGK